MNQIIHEENPFMQHNSSNGHLLSPFGNDVMQVGGGGFKFCHSVFKFLGKRLINVILLIFFLMLPPRRGALLSYSAILFIISNTIINL